MMSRRAYKPYAPNWSAPCLCGSGRRYRDCCRGRLPGSKIGESWRAAAEQEKWVLTIQFIRADVTQYTIWHISHTVPVGSKLAHPRLEWLLKVDIEALSAHVGNLCRAYVQAGRSHEIPPMLGRLEGNIADPRWARKIAYHKAISALWDDDRARAIREIELATPVRPTDDDLDLLQIYVDLHGSTMGMSERLAYFDRILELTKSTSDRLQYSGARAFELLMHGDENAARAGLEAVIESGRKAESEQPFTFMSELWFCKALEGLGVVKRDKALLAEVVARLSPYLRADQGLTNEGRALVYRSIGDAHRYASEYQLALAAYRSGRDTHPDFASMIFETECLLRLGEVNEAFSLISSIPFEDLDEHERADHAFTYFYVALARKERAGLVEARRLLSSAVATRPYFETMRLQYIVTAQDAISALEANKPLPRVSGLLTGLKSLSRYVQLQPNFFGIGLNLNNIIDDAIDRASQDGEPKSLNEKDG